MKRSASWACMVFLVLPASLAPGCGSDDRNDGEPRSITVNTAWPPTLLAFRDDTSSTWTSIPSAGLTSFQITATGAYEIAVSCTDTIDANPGRASTTLFGRTTRDDTVVDAPCPAPGSFLVHLAMARAGWLWFGGGGVGSDLADWGFSTRVAPGTFDVVLEPGDLEAPDGIAFVRDIAIEDDTELGSVDDPGLTVHPLVDTVYALPALRDGEFLLSEANLFATGTTAQLVTRDESDGAHVHLAPASALRASDRQTVELLAFSAPSSDTSTVRWVQRDAIAGESAALALPDPLGLVDFDASPERLTATWSIPSDYDQLDVVWSSVRQLSDTSSRSRLQRHVLTRAFLEASGAPGTTTIDFADVPGFQPAWQVEADIGASVSLTARQTRSASEHAFASVLRARPGSPGAPRPALGRASLDPAVLRDELRAWLRSRRP